MPYTPPRVILVGTIATIDTFHRQSPQEGGEPIPCEQVGIDGPDGCRLRVEVFNSYPSSIPGLGAAVQWVVEVRARESHKTFSDGRRWSPLIDFLYLASSPAAAPAAAPEPSSAA